MYIHIFAYICKHAYIHSCIHTYIYVYAYTYLCIILCVNFRIILRMLTQPHQDLKKHNRKSDRPVHPFFPLFAPFFFHTYEWVMSHISTSHGTHMAMSRTGRREWVMSNICILFIIVKSNTPCAFINRRSVSSRVSTARRIRCRAISNTPFSSVRNFWIVGFASSLGRTAITVECGAGMEVDSVLQWVTVSCSVLQCVAVSFGQDHNLCGKWCGHEGRQCVAVFCIVLQCPLGRMGMTVQCVAVRCSALWGVVGCCRVLQGAVTCIGQDGKYYEEGCGDGVGSNVMWRPNMQVFCDILWYIAESQLLGCTVERIEGYMNLYTYICMCIHENM